MKTILAISDTHGLVPNDVLKFASQADEVWHAGDWLTFDLADALKEKSNLRAVHGNIDNPIIKKVFPENLIFETEGVKVLIRHIAGYPGKYNPQTLALIKQEKPKIVMAGHSHILKVIRDKQHQHLHINPGAAGIKGFHQVRTWLRFKIENGRIFDMEVIESPKKALIH